jgi:acid phosphatase type 7
VLTQARWLESVLTQNPNRWTVAVFHHPVFSVARGRDNPAIQDHWQPLLEEHGVDLVLQGHDHTYGRGGNVTEGTMAWDGRVGTMYVVSVAGPKMYFASDAARETLDRIGEDTQLYQIDPGGVGSDGLRVQDYHGSSLRCLRAPQDGGRPNRLVDLTPPEGERFCGRPDIPGYRADRCWEGTDFVRPPGGDESRP